MKLQTSPHLKQKFTDNVDVRESIIVGEQNDSIPEKLHDLEQDNEELLHKIAQLEHLMNSMKLQMKTQDQLLIKKEEEIISLKQAKANLEK